MTQWKDEQTWLAAREGVLAQIRTWEQSPWVHYKGHTHSGPDKDKQIAQFRDQLARIEAAGEPAWRERLHA